LIIRTQIGNLQQELVRLLEVRNMLPAFKGFTNKRGEVLGLKEVALLPIQVARVKEWLVVEV
jgi:hypothetical protein